jgi:hypothetical protein
LVQVRAQAHVAEASPGERAHEVLRRIVRDKDVDVRAEVKAWAAELERAQEAGRAPTVEEHTTVTFVLRSGLFDHPEDPAMSPSDLAELRRFNGEVRQQLERCLGNSWRTLTGEEPRGERRLERLPARVLRKATRKARGLSRRRLPPRSGIGGPSDRPRGCCGTTSPKLRTGW